MIATEDGHGAACWGPSYPQSWCGRHCKAMNSDGSACVRAPHGEDDPVHTWGTPPCDPEAAVKEPRP